MLLQRGGLCVLLVAIGILGAQGQKGLRDVRFTSGIAVTEGFFVQAYAGPGVARYGDLKQDLIQSASIGVDSVEFALDPSTTTYGLQAAGIYRRFVLRGFAGFTQSATSTTFKGGVQTRTSNLGAHVGYLVYNQKRWLVFPYAGLSVGSTRLELQNYDSQPIQFGADTVDIARTGTFRADVAQIELGGSVRYMLSESGGVLVGLDFGGALPLGSQPWANDDLGGREVEGVAPHTLGGFYLRFTLGIGLFREGVKKTPSDTDTLKGLGAD